MAENDRTEFSIIAVIPTDDLLSVLNCFCEQIVDVTRHHIFRSVSPDEVFDGPKLVLCHRKENFGVLPIGSCGRRDLPIIDLLFRRIEELREILPRLINPCTHNKSEFPPSLRGAW